MLKVQNKFGYLSGIIIEVVTALLYPQEDIIEDGLAMINQEIIIFEKLGSQQISES